MNRGVDRRTVFFDDEARLEFGYQLKSAHERFGAELLAYCLMGNHYHLLLRTEPGTLSPTMQHIASRFTQRTNQRLNRDGPLFRGRFHSIPVTTDAYLLAAFRYIHQNPSALRVPIERYRWSSYGVYLGERRVPDFVDPTLLRSMIGSRSALLDFHAVRGFTDLLARHRGDASTTIRHLVDLAVSVDALDQSDDRHNAAHLERTVLRLLEPRPAVTASTLAAACGGSPSERAHAVAVVRARARQAADPVVDRVMALLDDWVPPIGSST